MLLDWSITVVKVHQTTYYLQLWPVARLGSQTPSEPTGSFLLCRVPAQPCSPATGAQAKPQAQGRSLYETTRLVCQQNVPQSLASRKTEWAAAMTSFSGHGTRSNGSLLETSSYNNGNSRQTGCSGSCTHHPPTRQSWTSFIIYRLHAAAAVRTLL